MAARTLEIVNARASWWLMAVMVLASRVLAGTLPTPGRPQLEVDVVVPGDPPGLAPRDQRPARVAIDFSALLAKANLAGEVDLGTLRITKIGAGNQPAGGASSALASEVSSLPLRWDDEPVVGDFPSVERSVDGATGKLDRGSVRNAGLFYNVSAGQSARGRLVWTHTRGAEGFPTRYRIAVSIRRDGQPGGFPPRAWLGDGVARFTTSPPNTTGSSHTRIDVADLDGDGLADLVYGESSGRILVLRNRGSARKPVFNEAEFLTDEAGRAIDAGQTSAPLVVDWDGDGRKDLLIGTHWNRILFFRNVGGKPLPRFEYQGVVKLAGKPLELPIAPVTGRPPGAFLRDYYPVLAAVDWDGDGQLDLVAGGYVTGRIFVFKNVGRNADGTPALQALGPVKADGAIINVGDWGAAPSVADINGDGLPDLISGNMPMTRESTAKETPLRLYINHGRRAEPSFREVPFPAEGRPPHGSLYSPRLADLNGDGLLDLAVSTGANIYWFANTGTRNAPRFSMHGNYLRPAWGNSPLPVTQWIDWDHDGRIDAVSDYAVRLNLGTADPFSFGPARSILPPGQQIAHPSGIGDDWFHPRFFDFDGDGDLDILFGDWHGQIWLHEKRDTGYDQAGRLLRLESGQPIKVGPKDLDPKTSFLALQGARTVMTAYDFNRRGRTDLVVGDTYGIVRYFENSGTNQEPVFREAQVLGNLGTRLSVDLIDWNDDGRMDVIAGSANGRVRVFLNQAVGPAEKRFAAGVDPGLPPIPQPRIITGDLNGDGDVDLFLPSTQGSVWLERSFLRHGYAEGKVEAIRAGAAP